MSIIIFCKGKHHFLFRTYILNFKLIDFCHILLDQGFINLLPNKYNLLMSNSYKLSVNNGNTFDLRESDLHKLDAVRVDASKFHILKDSKPYKVEIVSADFISKRYTVKVNNNTYEVAISNDLDQLISSMGIERGKTKIVNAIKAPMPGLILEISVEVGQTVKENDPLLILEAMKMENSFLSPRDGIIKSIAVEKGHAVDKGQLLIEFE